EGAPRDLRVAARAPRRLRRHAAGGDRAAARVRPRHGRPRPRLAAGQFQRHGLRRRPALGAPVRREGDAAVPMKPDTLEKEMEAQSLVPLWQVYERVVTQEPSLDAPSHLWRWRDLERAVKLTTELVHGKDADHRVLVLKHPKLAPRVATANNILGAVQCVLPGEKTSPHRHTPAAVRLVLEGAGGGTFVDGVRCEMRTGDFIVTPNWTWHCHENDAERPVTWVDILDV